MSDIPNEPTLPTPHPKPPAQRHVHEADALAPAIVWGEDYFDPRDCRPLLLLHALPQRPNVFALVARRLAWEGFLPIAPYLYDHLYERPDRPEEYQLARFLDTAVAVADRWDCERIEVVGIGLGAAVGWMLAARYPERVSRLAAIQLPHTGAVAKKPHLGVEGTARRRLRREPLRSRRKRVRELLIEQGAPEDLMELYMERLSAPGLLEVALAWNAPQPPEELPPLKVPVLLVSHALDHPAAVHRVQQLVPPGLLQEAVIEGTRFPLENASTELQALLERHLRGS